MKSPIKAKKTVKETKAVISAKEEKELEPKLEDREIAPEVVAEKKAEDNGDKVGTMLKAARIKKNLEISDIAKQLCIRKVYLDAIENSDYEEIPDYPYGPGFVRSYADFLGLNGARLVQVYKDETSSKNKSAQDYYVPEPQVEVVAPNRKYLLISLLSIILIYAVWYLYSRTTVTPDEIEALGQTSMQTEEYPLPVNDFTEVAEATEDLLVVDVSNAPQDITQITVSEESFTEEEPEVAETPVSEATANPANGVFLKVKQETWVAVQDAEKLYLSKVLKEGDTYTIPRGGKDMKLSVGRYGAVDVYVNGKLTEVIEPNKKTNIDLNQYTNQ